MLLITAHRSLTLATALRVHYVQTEGGGDPFRARLSRISYDSLPKFLNFYILKSQAASYSNALQSEQHRGAK